MTENTNILKIEKITPKPPKHEAVLLTEDNWQEVIEWLGADPAESKLEKFIEQESVVTIAFYPRRTIGYIRERLPFCVNPGLYIIKPARNYDGSQDEPFVLGAAAYEKFFKKAR